MKTQALYKIFILIALFTLSIAVIIGVPFIGMTAISIKGIFSKTTGAFIFWNIRLPRVLIAFLAGSALAASGAAFQAMFRNPLATPFTLGVAQGAALGASLYLWLGLRFDAFGFSGISFFGFIGAVAAILIVYGLTRLKKGFAIYTILLAGVVVSFFFSSLILFIQYASDFTRSLYIMRWLMGGLETVGYRSVLDMAPLVLAGNVIIILFTNELNLLVIGEDIAVSRGVDLRRTKIILFLSVSLMVGGVVSVCGPIGFVGLIVPHICRLVIGHDYRQLVPAVILLGGIFLTVCDMLSRTLIAPAEMPVGIITSLLGAPFFIWLLFRK